MQSPWSWNMKTKTKQTSILIHVFICFLGSIIRSFYTSTIYIFSMLNANTKSVYQPVHLSCLVRVFVIRFLESMIRLLDTPHRVGGNRKTLLTIDIRGVKIAKKTVFSIAICRRPAKTLFLLIFIDVRHQYWSFRLLPTKYSQTCLKQAVKG